MPFVTRVLYAAAAFLVVLGVVLFVALSMPERRAAAATPVGSGPGLGGGATAPGATAEPRSAESFALVVDSNMFSPTRTAPRVRFTIKPAEATPAPTAPRAPSSPPLRVFGITLRSTDSTALIDADPRVPGAEIYRVGDTLFDGTLIIEITDSTVVVEGPRGVRVLRLEAKAKP